MTPNAASPSPFPLDFRLAGYALGFALGGFFDGILLHQILQWHHLLSGLEGGRLDDLRFQILADGFFHALMYVVGLAGLGLLWHARVECGRPRADRILFAHALIGFGAWHILDAVLSHWVLAIHRVRMDSEVPLVWDLLWFAVFGVAFVLAGLRVRRDGPPPARRSRSHAPAALVAATLLAGAAALAPPSAGSATTTVVVFRPGLSPAQAMAATRAAGGRLVWSDPSDGVWTVDLPPGADRIALYRGGALLVSDTLLPVGCLNWFRDARRAPPGGRLRADVRATPAANPA